MNEHILQITCSECKVTDLVSTKNAQDWKCKSCEVLEQVKPKWKHFDGSERGIRWIWYSRYGSMDVGLVDTTKSFNYLPNDLWAVANIVFPAPPKLIEKSLHRCGYAPELECLEDIDNNLHCYYPKCKIKVQFCPFCGYQGK